MLVCWILYTTNMSSASQFCKPSVYSLAVESDLSKLCKQSLLETFKTF